MPGSTPAGAKTLRPRSAQSDEDIARVQASARPSVPTSPEDRRQPGLERSAGDLALRGMEKYKIQLVEQPVVAWDTAGLKAVRLESPIPIMAD